MTRAYCLTCNEQVDVDDDGRCPRGHVVSAEDLGPQPWIGRALSAVGKPPVRAQAADAGDPGSDDSEPGDPAPATDEPDELAALLADLDDGGPADLDLDDVGPADVVTEDESAPTDTASELAALAEELALRSESPEPADGGDDDFEDDDLGALDDAISAWDESDEAIVAPSEPVPDDEVDESPAVGDLEGSAVDEPVVEVTADELAAADRIPPPPPAGAEPPGMAPPPPPPPAPAPPIEDLFAEDDAAPHDDLPPMEEAVEPDPVPEEPPADEATAAPPEIDLTNFTASGKRIDTSSAPRKKGGRFGFGR